MALHERLIIAQVQKPKVFRADLLPEDPSSPAGHEAFGYMVEALEDVAMLIEERGGKVIFSSGCWIFFESDQDIGIGNEVEPNRLEQELEGSKGKSLTAGYSPMDWGDWSKALEGVQFEENDYFGDDGKPLTDEQLAAKGLEFNQSTPA